MNWRRGLLLAGIHLAIVGFVVYMYEDMDATMLSHSIDAGELIMDGPCPIIWDDPSPLTMVVPTSNLPAFALTGWRIECPGPRTLSGILHANGWEHSVANIAALRSVDLIFCALVSIQWFLIGSFPVRRIRRWWAEPGVLVTICVVIAGCLCPFWSVRLVAEFIALLPLLAWLWWLSLLLWKAIRFAWQSTVAHVPRLTH